MKRRRAALLQAAGVVVAVPATLRARRVGGRAAAAPALVAAFGTVLVALGWAAKGRRLPALLNLASAAGLLGWAMRSRRAEEGRRS